MMVPMRATVNKRANRGPPLPPSRPSALTPLIYRPPATDVFLPLIAFAALAAGRRQAGRPISQADAQIAAIARSRGAALATRNVPDFEGCEVEIVDPWGATP